MKSEWNKQQGKTFTAVLTGLLMLALAASIYWMMPEESTETASNNNASAEVVPENSFAIENVRIFDGEQVHQKQTVLVTDGLITEVLENLQVPEGIESIDGSGKTLLPGLIDAHVHTFEMAQQDALRFGVTTAIDLFSDHNLLAGNRTLREQIGQQDQADVYSAGTLITAPGGHGTQFGMTIPTLSNAADADEFVAARQAEGSDFIKVVYENGSEYNGNIPTLDQQTLKAVIDAAKTRGMLTIVHVSTLEFAKHALQVGADGLAHMFSDSPADQELIELAQQNNAFIVATLAVQASISGQSQIDRWMELPEVAGRLSQMQQNNLSNAFFSIQSGALNNAQQSLASLHAAGVRILAGSDAPNPGTAHGIGLHQELWWLTEAGLTPLQALQAATAHTADVFGLTDRGRIAKGLRADLLLVEGNPLTDIDATLNTVRVWKDGFPVNRELVSLPDEVPTEVLAGITAGMLSDFEGPAADVVETRWQVTTDSMLGGQSSAEIEQHSDTQQQANQYLHISGEVKTGSMFPWAGVSTFVSDQPMAPADAGSIQHLRFRARGMPGEYQLMVFSGSQNNAMPAIQPITLSTDWQQYEFELAAIAGVDLSLLRGFAWTAGNGHSRFEFDLDDVELQ